MSDPESEADPSNECEFVLQEANIERLSRQSVADQIELFSTVSNETRYRILTYLIAADEPICGCELEPHLDVGQSTVSQSLNRLRKTGLVTRTKDGRWRYYEPTPVAEQLVELVEDNFADELLVAD
ncbi:MAG: metalloregulator ArsR/SmtB family transcription factor [Halovenus sp.]|uniref:ArsR/SmtB family transcription factor n=1 Tax=Halovenus amylolytica TaxID=2500550 RepID=UPI000FE2E67E